MQKWRENYCPAAKDNKLLIFIPAAAAAEKNGGSEMGVLRKGWS